MSNTLQGVSDPFLHWVGKKVQVINLGLSICMMMYAGISCWVSNIGCLNSLCFERTWTDPCCGVCHTVNYRISCKWSGKLKLQNKISFNKWVPQIALITVIGLAICYGYWLKYLLRYWSFSQILAILNTIWPYQVGPREVSRLPPHTLYNNVQTLPCWGLREETK